MKNRIAMLLLGVFLVGCTTVQPLPDTRASTVREAVRPGDTVVVETTAGARRTLRFVEVTDDAIVGAGGQRIPLASVRSVSTRAMTTQDKIWTGVIVGVAIGGGILLLNDDDSGSGGGGGGY